MFKEPKARVTWWHETNADLLFALELNQGLVRELESIALAFNLAQWQALNRGP